MVVQTPHSRIVHIDVMHPKFVVILLTDTSEPFWTCAPDEGKLSFFMPLKPLRAPAFILSCFTIITMFNIFLKVLASQKRLENKYKAAEQASEDWYILNL